jgi:hypothetical protein
MLCPRPTPLNRRPTVPNLPNPHRAHPPAKRVRSSAKCSRKLCPTERLRRVEYGHSSGGYQARDFIQ